MSVDSGPQLPHNPIRGPTPVSTVKCLATCPLGPSPSLGQLRACHPEWPHSERPIIWPHYLYDFNLVLRAGPEEYRHLAQGVKESSMDIGAGGPLHSCPVRPAEEPTCLTRAASASCSMLSTSSPDMAFSFSLHRPMFLPLGEESGLRNSPRTPTVVLSHPACVRQT